jgi:2-keto-4-pentenoate hydratase
LEQKVESEVNAENRKEEIEAYIGPEGDIEKMDAVDVKDTGIQVMIGESPTGYGKGLFLSILNDVENVTIPDGSLICDYGNVEITIYAT